MAIEALSGSANYNSTNTVQKPDYKTNDVKVQETAGTVNMSVKETPAGMKASGSNQTQSDQGKGQQESTVTEKNIKNAITRANNKMKAHRTRCEFSYHEETKRISIKVFDQDTEQVIREIPPEETLEMLEKMWELAGILVDEKR